MLARDLHMTHARLMKSVSTKEFHMWAALYAIEYQERKDKPGG